MAHAADPHHPVAFDAEYAAAVQRHLAQARLEGQAEGKAQALLTILVARGVAPSAAQCAGILPCRDLARLERWIARAVTAGVAPPALDAQARRHARAQAQAVVTTLVVRGLALAPAQRARILACRDLARLERWHARACLAPSVAQALGDGPRPAPGARPRAPRRRAVTPEVKRRAEAKAKTLQVILAARGLAPAASQRVRIRACHDPAWLDRCIARAIVADSAAEALGERPRPVPAPGARPAEGADARRQVAQSRAEGQAEGKAEGMAGGLLTVLSLRGLAVSPARRARILACRDLARLERWIARAVTAASAAQALGARARREPPARPRAPRRSHAARCRAL
ncbi:MAG TPA: hypothetical protein VGQ83_22665 [Polyangia bacterium]|jgi:hypothetical protein